MPKLRPQRRIFYSGNGNAGDLHRKQRQNMNIINLVFDWELDDNRGILYLDSVRGTSSDLFRRALPQKPRYSPNYDREIVYRLRREHGVQTAIGSIEDFTTRNPEICRNCNVFFLDFCSTPAGNRNCFPFTAIHDITRAAQERILLAITFSTHMNQRSRYLSTEIRGDTEELFRHQLEDAVLVDTNWEIQRKEVYRYGQMVHCIYILQKSQMPPTRTANYITGMRKINGVDRKVRMGFRGEITTS